MAPLHVPPLPDSVCADALPFLAGDVGEAAGVWGCSFLDKYIQGNMATLEQLFNLQYEVK